MVETDLTYRNHNVLNFKQDLEHLITIPQMPVFLGCVDTPPKLDLKIDQNWYISKSTGIVQLNPLVPLGILYGQAHGAGILGDVWKRHNQAFAKFLEKFSINNVLEIGAGSGQLCKNYLANNSDTKWTIIEPNPGIKSDNNITVIKGMFDEHFNIPKDTGCIVSSHLLEHLYEPVTMLQNINDALSANQLHLFSVPNIKRWTEQGYASAINFEHNIYLVEEHIDAILECCGFTIVEKRYFADDHSIFYATKKVDKKGHNIQNLYKENKAAVLGYFSGQIKLVEGLNRQVSQHNGEVFLFGGHIFSQLLLGFGLNESDISCVIDNDKNKQGKRLYGTGLIVKSPQVLDNLDNPTVIIRAGHHSNEIKEGITRINDKVTYW